MNDNAKAFARNMFRLQIHESNGQKFEDLFTKIMGYKEQDFRAVKPHGNIGDRKNDGWIESKNAYFQVYAPDDITKSIAGAVTKLHADFKGLYQYWNSKCPVQNFYFVLNDKYKGTPPQIHDELLSIKSAFNLDDARVYTASNLERDLFQLADDVIVSVVGHIPNIDSSEYMFISGFTCFITAWIEFEKTARAKIGNLHSSARPIVGSFLIRELFNQSIISDQELTFLLLISNNRNRLVHGDTAEIPKKDHIDMLMDITEKL